MLLIKRLVFTIFFGFSLASISNEIDDEINVNIAALAFSGVVQENLQGAFDYMMLDLASSANVKHNYHVVSPARGAKMLFSNRTDCVIPSSNYPPYFKGIDVIHSESFAHVTYLAFTLKSKSIISDKKQLRGKTIGIIRDEESWNYEQRFNINNATFIKVNNLESLVEMLNHNRIDVAIHDHADFLAMSMHLKRPEPNFDFNSPIAIDELIITCLDNAHNRAYLQAISPHLKKIITTNKIRDYYKMATIK